MSSSGLNILVNATDNLRTMIRNSGIAGSTYCTTADAVPLWETPVSRPKFAADFDESTLEKIAGQMWDKMYIHAQKVIVPCPWCGSHNAITNPVCVRCGGAMGAK